MSTKLSAGRVRPPTVAQCLAKRRATAAAQLQSVPGLGSLRPSPESPASLACHTRQSAPARNMATLNLAALPCSCDLTCGRTFVRPRHACSLRDGLDERGADRHRFKPKCLLRRSGPDNRRSP
jgi:hypothetical protein